MNPFYSIAIIYEHPEWHQPLFEMLDKQRISRLTPDEEAELDECVHVNHFVTMLKAEVLNSMRENGISLSHQSRTQEHTP